MNDFFRNSRAKQGCEPCDTLIQFNGWNGADHVAYIDTPINDNTHNFSEFRRIPFHPTNQNMSHGYGVCQLVNDTLSFLLGALRIFQPRHKLTQHSRYRR